MLDPLGFGSSATVYRARDGEDREFAVKVRKRGITKLDRRFLREFESMRSLRLPGVVRVYHAGIEGDLLWFSMDRIHGRHIFEVIRDYKDLDRRVQYAIRVGRKLLETIAALHHAGIIHRDLKPTNVLVDANDHVTVLDFGIVRYFGDRDTTSAAAGEILGTVPFMAPEQIAALPFDRSVDLYAAGILFYESIAGPRQRPKTTVGWIPKICLERLVPLASLYREVPRGLSTLIERLTRVDPCERPSAAEAARMMRRLEAGWDDEDWPDPPFVDPGDWWIELEGCIGLAGQRPVQVLEGPTGSGRRRLSEQIFRTGVMQGTWPLTLHCRIDHVGGPMLEFLEVLLAFAFDDGWVRGILGEDGDTLRRMWPSLPLPGVVREERMPTSEEVAEAFARTVARAAARKPLLLIIHDLERVDPLTARALPQIASRAGRTLGMLVLHDDRWMTTLSHQIVAGLQARFNAGVHRMRPLTQEVARTIASSLCPQTTPPMLDPGTPQHAVEAGWAALAHWRREPWSPPDANLWPLAVRDAPVPVKVLERLVGRQALTNAWVRQVDDGIVLTGAHARRAAGTRLADLQTAARLLARAWEGWETELGASGKIEHLPELFLLAGDPAAAWKPAARAAAEAEEVGRYADARRWLFLLDTLPAPPDMEGDLAFELAYIRARVALRTEVNAPRVSLVEACERLARTDRQELLVRLVQAEHKLRDGQARPALVTALRVASVAIESDPQVAVRALLVAIHSRMVLGQIAEVPRELHRAEALLTGAPDKRLAVQVANWRTELLIRQHRLEQCRVLSQATISRASEARYVRGAAFASSQLGLVLRMLGKRRESEHQARGAREGFASTGDVVLDAEAELALATLLAERGDAAGARHLLDDTIRRIRAFHLPHLLPSAMRVTLQIACHTLDTTDAAMALTRLAESAVTDPEVPSVQVRWWRIRGDVKEALAIEPPSQPGYGLTLWRIEHARARLLGGFTPDVIDEARRGLQEARRAGFKELELYALLILGAMGHEDVDWQGLLARASGSLCIEVYLGALELEARRLMARGEEELALSCWRTLRIRARELGYEPAVQEASGWLPDRTDAGSPVPR
ncbi:MAG: serine/threonine protein kinase [Deltaproteobacteria bacterium]|nr:serine/threonine protein kinase [Deltaproteobacteria bacterium]